MSELSILKLLVQGGMTPIAACVKDFQQKNGLTVDGIIGEKTWACLIR